jgi:ABC-type uncharacterized transport system ATPase component
MFQDRAFAKLEPGLLRNWLTIARIVTGFASQLAGYLGSRVFRWIEVFMNPRGEARRVDPPARSRALQDRALLRIRRLFQRRSRSILKRLSGGKRQAISILNAITG